MDDGGRLPLGLGEDDVDEVLGRRHDRDLLEVVLHHRDGEDGGEGGAVDGHVLGVTMLFSLSPRVVKDGTTREWGNRRPKRE